MKKEMKFIKKKNKNVGLEEKNRPKQWERVFQWRTPENMRKIERIQEKYHRKKPHKMYLKTI